MTIASGKRARHTELALWAIPAFVAVGIVADHYADSAGHWTSALRLLVVVAGSTIIVQFVTWLIGRRIIVATVAATGLLLFLTGQWFPLILLVYLLIGAAILNWRRTGQWVISLPVVGLVTLVVGLAGVVNIVLSGVIAWTDVVEPAAESVGDPDGSPSIFIVLLDGYPRADSLQRSFGYDNSEFLSALGQLGFEVYPRATSSTQATSQTLLEMLGGSVPGRNGDEAGSELTGHAFNSEIRRRLATAPLLGKLHDRGYETTVIVSPIVHVEPRGWLSKIDSGQLTDLEISFLARSPISRLGAVSDWVMDDQRGRQMDTFESLLALNNPGRQQFVLAHVMSPHAPFLWTADGMPRGAPACWPEQCNLFAVSPETLALDPDEFASRFVSQTEYLNAQVLAAAEHMVATDPSAVIVIMSDHGSRHDPDDIAERFRILLAVRTPGQRALLDESPRPATLLHLILGAYDSSSR